MLSKKEKKLDFSPLHYQFKKAKNFEEVSFVDLLLKQNNSKRKNLLSQLGLKGMGFICLQHNVEITEQVMRDYTTLLRNSDTKVFRTEDDNSSDPTRKQLLTTYGNVRTSLNAANVKTKHKVTPYNNINKDKLFVFVCISYLLCMSSQCKFAFGLLQKISTVN